MILNPKTLKCDICRSTWVASRARRGLGGLLRCPACARKTTSKRYVENNSDKRKETSAKYYITKGADKIRKRRSSDIRYRLAIYLRNRLNKALKGNAKSGSAVKDLGCSIEELKLHLEKQFQPGMTWENHGKWHIDHIMPIASFDITDREQFLKANNFTNLQPLWAKVNLQKGSK